MAWCTAERLAAIVDRFQRPAVFVESGTWHGATTRLAIPMFRDVHTIEINPRLFNAARRELRGFGVRCYLGNSARVVPKLAGRITEPVCWYLDAHWFKHQGETIAGSRVRLPLFTELRAIATRTVADIVIVDDVHCFEGRGPTADWNGVSLASIAAHFPSHRAAEIVHDQAVVWR